MQEKDTKHKFWVTIQTTAAMLITMILLWTVLSTNVVNWQYQQAIAAQEFKP